VRPGTIERWETEDLNGPCLNDPRISYVRSWCSL
jgi:hypothetical protein